jgi:dihydropteroate synthase
MTAPVRAAPLRRLRARELELELGERPWLMGVVNASPDSFSDGGRHGTLEQQVEHAGELLAAGADILDVGGQSARADRPPVAEAQELERVVPLLERLGSELDALVSIDTYSPAVARAAIAAGARIVNDVSALRNSELARICADTGAALVVMHTLATPGQRRQDPELYGEDIAGDVIGFLRERMTAARAAGVAAEQMIVDPGPDFAKTPAQTVALLAHAERLHELGRPVLMAVSRKDFIGALTARPPRGRLAGTLAALAHGIDAGAHIFRVHDVAAAADFVKVRRALAGELEVSADLALAEELRFEALG